MSKIIDENTLFNVVSDIELYISKNYKLSQLEYQIILNILRDNMIKRKIEKKKNEMNKSIPSLIKNVKKQMFGEEK